MPQILITRSTVVNKTNVRAGDVVSVSDSDARLLLRIGHAEPAPASTQATAALLRPRPAARRAPSTGVPAP